MMKKKKKKKKKKSGVCFLPPQQNSITFLSAATATKYHIFIAENKEESFLDPI